MGKTIMIIDDSKTIRRSVGYILQKSGYIVIEAADGTDALEKLNGMSLDMFICDVNMPNMSGISFLKKVKNEDEYSSYRFTPFIMLTTEACRDRIDEGRKEGAKAWLIKPFNPEQLITAVQTLIM